MKGSAVRFFAVLALVIGANSPAWSADNMPSVSDLLFLRKDFSDLGAGSKLTYRFQRTVSESKLLGEPFSDDISVSVNKVEDDDKREVELKIFTGARARPVQELPHRDGNPIIVVFLERIVKNYGAIAGGKHQYLKNRLRVDMRENAKIEPEKIQYDGKTVDGYRVTLTPFVKDPNRHKMYGYQGSRFDVIVSDNVPGRIVEMIAVYESPMDGAPRLEERIKLAESSKFEVDKETEK